MYEPLILETLVVLRSSCLPSDLPAGRRAQAWRYSVSQILGSSPDLTAMLLLRVILTATYLIMLEPLGS